MGRNLGRNLTEEHKKRIAKSHIGKIHSEETKAKMAESHKRRISLSDWDYQSIKVFAKANNISIKSCLSKMIKLACEKLNHHESGKF